MSATGASSAPVLCAFATQENDLAVLRQFSLVRGWPVSNIFQGDIKDATNYLRSYTPPEFLLVEIPSADTASDLLSQLAEVCPPETKVIVIGTVNEYSFYCWLMGLGIFSYLLMPLSLSVLEHTWEKAAAPVSTTASTRDSQGNFIGVIGTRGGVGSTSLALYLAAVMAENEDRKVALVDLDPQDGSISLLLDLEPSRGFREALEKPERIDHLFLKRVLQNTPFGFQVLSGEEPIGVPVHFHEQAAATLIRELRTKFDTIILDMPRRTNNFYRDCLKACNKVVAVTDLSLLSLRDSLRLADLFREQLKMPLPLFVANHVGMAVKYEMSAADFSKGLSLPLTVQIPFAPEVFMSIGAELPALKSKPPAMKVIHELAKQLDPSLASDSEGGDGKRGWKRKK